MNDTKLEDNCRGAGNLMLITAIRVHQKPDGVRWLQAEHSVVGIRGYPSPSLQVVIIGGEALQEWRDVCPLEEQPTKGQ